MKLRYKPKNLIVSASMVDMDGRYPNHVHSQEMGYWYPAEDFEIVTEVVTLEPAKIEDLLNS